MLFKPFPADVPDGQAFISHCIPSSVAKYSEINYFMQWLLLKGGIHIALLTVYSCRFSQ